jgi:NAD(P)-dependent dehydrogenase (short-subunit alcohol dehydrogenase family)
VGSAANVGYAMSKSALHGITKSLSIELAPKNIRVNCVAPGFIKTKMLEDISDSFNDNYSETITKLHPLGLGDPEDVANVIAFLLSDMSKWITGSILSVDGGYTAL